MMEANINKRIGISLLQTSNQNTLQNINYKKRAHIDLGIYILTR